MKHRFLLLVGIFVLSPPLFGQSREERIQTLLREIGIRPMERAVDSLNFDLPNLNGTRTLLNNHRGSFVFLNFWATWCPPCREEMPAMEYLQNALEDSSFTILAVSVQEDPTLVQRFVDEFGVTFPILLDRSGQVSRSYGVRALPTSYFIAADGQVAGILVGIVAWDDPEVVARFHELMGLYQ